MRRLIDSCQESGLMVTLPPRPPAAPLMLMVARSSGDLRPARRCQLVQLGCLSMQEPWGWHQPLSGITRCTGRLGSASGPPASAPDAAAAAAAHLAGCRWCTTSSSPPCSRPTMALLAPAAAAGCSTCHTSPASATTKAVCQLWWMGSISALLMCPCWLAWGRAPMQPTSKSRTHLLQSRVQRRRCPPAAWPQCWG